LERKFDTTYHPESELVGLLQRAVALPSGDGASDDPSLAEALAVLSAFDLATDVDDPHASLAILALGPFIEPPSHPTDDQLRQSVLDAATTLRDHFGSLEVPWGEVNRLRRGPVDLPLAGAPDVLHAVYGQLQDDGRLKGWAGDCFVMIAQWDADGRVSSQSLHQYGSATMDQTSDHYADQTALFADRRLKPVWLKESDIRRRLEREYRPGHSMGASP